VGRAAPIRFAGALILTLPVSRSLSARSFARYPAQGHDDDLERFVGVHTELTSGQRESIRSCFELLVALGNVVSDRGSSGDSGAASPGGFGNAGTDEFAVGAGDGIGRHIEFDCERSNGRQTIAWRESAGCDLQGNLRTDLLEWGHRCVVVEPNAHELTLPDM